MPWSLLIWLLCFCLQAALVGILFYVVTQLYDFEMDYINTFDAAKNVNRWVMPEIALQLSVISLSFFGGHWIAAGLNCLGLALILQRFVKGKQFLEPLELWKQFREAQKNSYWKLGTHVILFAFTMFRLMEVVVSQVLTEHGRAVMKNVLKEAIGNVHF